MLIYFYVSSKFSTQRVNNNIIMFHISEEDMYDQFSKDQRYNYIPNLVPAYLRSQETYSLTISRSQFQLKIDIYQSFCLTLRLQQIFAHATTAQLSWHVQ